MNRIVCLSVRKVHAYSAIHAHLLRKKYCFQRLLQNPYTLSHIEFVLLFDRDA